VVQKRNPIETACARWEINMRQRVVACFGDIVKYSELRIGYEHEVVVVATVLPSGGEILNRGPGDVTDTTSQTHVSSAAVVCLASAGFI
jgi:hypothetical protein